MAGYKETPRQKMIAMMYLVLTALLALNVSKQILDAFLVVNESMESTNESLSARIEGRYAKFDKQYEMNKDKVEPYWKEAQTIKKESEDLVKYIEQLKFDLVRVSESRKTIEEIKNLYYQDTIINGEKKEMLMLAKVPTKDKYNATTFYLVRPNRKGEAYVLSARMKDFREKVLKTMNLPVTDTKIGLITNERTYQDADGQKQNWEQHNFYFTILAADITILNKIIGEVKSAEYNAINYLYGSVSEKDFKFDHVTAKVIPRSTYVLKGEKYEAEILVAAYDSKMKPDVRVLKGVDELTDKNISRAQTIVGEEGIVKLEFPANTEGLQKYAGRIEMIDPATNQKVSYPFSGGYIVAPPALIVAPLKMNVFYIGVDNPVAISSPGLADENIKSSIDIGTLKKNPKGDWIVRINKKPKGVSKVYISATATIGDKQLSLGKKEFRIKRVPDPTAEIAGQTGGQMDKNTLLAAAAIIPNMRDFEFDLYFEVTSFTFATIVNGDWLPKNVRGNRFTAEINNIIRNGKRKQKFFFENIQAKGPDGTTRVLNPINLEIK
ncbi:MAG: gliding motility protein GldM [Bacteroidales bacterium]|nr:gliding motility protein GldM [Bacteroidales bacterium]